MSEQMPENQQKRLAWSLWNLDLPNIKNSLKVGAKPYTLRSVVDVSKTIPQREQLSSYRIILVGYLARTYLQEDVKAISNALDTVFVCVKDLIKNKISIDQGVITLESHPTMRNFIQGSITRLNDEKTSEGNLDQEGKICFRDLRKDTRSHYYLSTKLIMFQLSSKLLPLFQIRKALTKSLITLSL